MDKKKALLEAWDRAVAALRSWDMNSQDIPAWTAGYRNYLRACNAIPSSWRLPWGVGTGL